MRGSFAIRPEGLCARVEVNGHDVSSAVRTVDLRFEAGNVPQVDLELAVVEVQEFASEEAELLIPSDVHDALVALGWTPPPDKSPEET